MKESILDVLLYLFEHYFANDAILTGDDFTAFIDEEQESISTLLKELGLT